MYVCISYVHAGLNEAKAADFSHNRLAALPHSLCQLLSLASLKLSHNCLQDAGVPWSELCSALSSSLNTLQLGNNQLQQVPACLQQLTALTHLGLEGNQLQHIEAGALEGLGKLEVLQLQDNQLQELPQDLGQPLLGARQTSANHKLAGLHAAGSAYVCSASTAGYVCKAQALLAAGNHFMSSD